MRLTALSRKVSLSQQVPIGRIRAGLSLHLKKKSEGYVAEKNRRWIQLRDLRGHLNRKRVRGKSPIASPPDGYCHPV
jgi:hypothetical protein